MSSPILIPRVDAPALYVPVHRRSPGSYTSSSSRTSSPSPRSTHVLSLTPSPSPSYMSLPPTSPSTRAHTPAPTHTPKGIYTPAELLFLSTSPLAKLSTEHMDALRVVAPEVVQTRKRRKAAEWHARQISSAQRRSHVHTSESDEDQAVSWRRV